MISLTFFFFFLLNKAFIFLLDLEHLQLKLLLCYDWPKEIILRVDLVNMQEYEQYSRANAG